MRILNIVVNVVFAAKSRIIVMLGFVGIAAACSAGLSVGVGGRQNIDVIIVAVMRIFDC